MTWILIIWFHIDRGLSSEKFEGFQTKEKCTQQGELMASTGFDWVRYSYKCYPDMRTPESNKEKR